MMPRRSLPSQEFGQQRIDDLRLLDMRQVAEARFGNMAKAVVDVDHIEFDSMINIRPSLGNRSRGVDDPEVRKKIVQVVSELMK